MRKKILIVLSFILMLTLTACSKNTPTETVQSSFDQIKSEINSDDNIKNKTKSLVKTLSGDNVNSDTVSCLLYIDLENGEDFINGLNHVKEAQIELSRPKD